MEVILKKIDHYVLKNAFETSLYVLTFAISIPAFFYYLGSLIDRIYTPLSTGYSLLRSIGSFLLLIGGTVTLIAILSLVKFGKGLPASPIPPKIFVKQGIYKIARHPIYLGASLSYLGGCLILNSFWNIVLCWPLLTLFFIAYAQCVEEPVLLKRFGKEYQAYREQVPFFCEFPLRKIILSWISSFLSYVSRLINKPFIIRFREHYLFLGYGLWLGLGSFIGLFIFNIILLKEGITCSKINWLVLFLTLISLLNGILVSMISLAVFEKIKLKKTWPRVGFVSWGYLLTVLFLGIVFAILTKKSTYLWFDSAFVPLMITYFFGRIGCMFYGCCYGKDSGARINISYHHPSLKAVREGLVKTNILYPTQLFSALYGLVIFIVIVLIWSMVKMRFGIPASFVFVLYGIFRFLEEWYRNQKILIGGIFSPAQIVSLVLITVGILHLTLILPNIESSFHAPLFQIHTKEIINQINIFFLLGMALLVTFVFSYHRHEIGRWA